MAPTPLILAHRGACLETRENTLAAFRLARDAGADGVELDVRRTGDGVLVVHHDAAAADFGVLAEFPMSEVRAGVAYVPTLVEALDVLAGMLVNIEIKASPADPDFDPEHGIVDGLVALLRDRGGHDSVIVSSFNLEAIDRVHELAPDLATGWLVLPVMDPDDALSLVADRGHRALHPNVKSMRGDVAAEVVRHARRLDVAVNVWTVDEPEDQLALAAAGVTSIITNDPRAARARFGA